MESLFDFPQFKITKKIRLIELFGGIGSQAMALRDIGADFEHYKLVEFDKYAVKSYNAIHDTRHTTHDTRHKRYSRKRFRNHRQRQILLFNDLFFSLHRFIRCRQNAGNEQGRLAEWKRNKKRFTLGS